MGDATWLQERNRRKAREKADETRLADAFEAYSLKRLGGEIAPHFSRHGVVFAEVAGSIERRADEVRRARLLVVQDRAERAADQRRKLAEMEVSEGNFVNLLETVVEPTPEWLAHFETTSFTAEQLDGTVRTVATVRRVRADAALRLWHNGKIGDLQFAACLWYRDRHEEAGLIGRYKTSRLDPMAGGGAGGGLAQAPMARHQGEAVAREEFRRAQGAIPKRFLRFFEAVVIEDASLRKAGRKMRCRNGRELAKFREASTALVDHLEEVGVDLVQQLRKLRG